ncbi:MAG: putative Importin subunit alpha-1 [Streblomastix strix]|uniref:Putative Importin subunit alpha-1 n=1 Tax=Streblomastix strix TaxID=222440 RepID=A0A5J4WBS9_9EUKA|nr:MAG: putative Importin subunit alpha-1 [Streblomastix strix]
MNNLKEKLEHLGVIVSLFSQPNINIVKINAHKLCNLTSKTVLPISFQDVINSGVLETFPLLLLRYDQPQLQEDLAWTLTNIFSGKIDQIISVIKIGVVPPLIELLVSHNEHVRKQAAWAIANIAHEDNEFIQTTLKDSGLEDQLLKLLQVQNSISSDSSQDQSLMKRSTNELINQVYLLAKVVCHMNLKKETLIAIAQVFINYLSSLDDAPFDVQLYSDSLNGLSIIIKDKLILSSLNFDSIIKALSKFISFPYYNISKIALKLLGHIIFCDEKHQYDVYSVDILSNTLIVLKRLQRQSNSKVVKEIYKGYSDKQIDHKNRNELLSKACILVSNISAGKSEQTSACVDSGCIEQIIHLLSGSELDINEMHLIEDGQNQIQKVIKNQNKYPTKIQLCQDWVKEAIYAVSNCLMDSRSVIIKVVKFGIIPELFRWMNLNIIDVISAIQSSLYNILFAKIGDDNNNNINLETAQVIGDNMEEENLGKRIDFEIEECGGSEEIDAQMFRTGDDQKYEVVRSTKNSMMFLLNAYKHWTNGFQWLRGWH